MCGFVLCAVLAEGRLPRAGSHHFHFPVAVHDGLVTVSVLPRPVTTLRLVPRVSLAILNTDIGTIFGDSTYWCLRPYESVYKQLISHIRNLLNVCLKQGCLYVDIGALSVNLNPLFDLFNVLNFWNSLCIIHNFINLLFKS